MTAEPLPLRHGRALLRRLWVGDLAAFQAVRGDAELARYQGWAAQTDDAASSFLAEMAALPLWPRGDWLQLAIADPGDAALLGDVGLFIADDGTWAEVGFTLARQAQGRGIATDAVQAALTLLWKHAGVAQVRATTDARNAASIRLLLRVGLREVARRETVFKGEACTEVDFVADRPAC